MDCNLQILFPTAQQASERRPLPTPTKAVGITLARIGDEHVRMIRAFATPYVGNCLGTAEPAIETREFKPFPREGYLKWMLPLPHVPTGPERIQLTVEAFGSTNVRLASTCIDLWVKSRGRPLAPDFDWPPLTYTLDAGEQSYFYCCGPSDYAVVGVTFDGVSRADGGWDSGTNYWWGEFYNLGTTPGTGGPYDLVVTNTYTPSPIATARVTI